MPRIRVIVEDDDGQPLGSSPEQVYLLDSVCQNLDQIEASVETFRIAALPALEAKLIHAAQHEQVEQEKKDTQYAATEQPPSP
ncbi:MAG: hypothetical protein ABIY70_15535 [Capsulimonas sp.]|uniref:hypothetical protein n=1 Tax=Capsulimonas sp. TaxID=2494211 RepID=UPI003267007D